MNLRTMPRDEFRLRMRTFAVEAAQRHHLRENPGATEDQAFRFACRHWRRPEFLQVAADCLAWWHVLDEDAAAHTN